MLGRPMSDVSAEPATCLNCGAPLAGPYCHACGQKAGSLHVGLHDFVHDATHEFLHLDGKIVRTVKLLLTRPGLLTREFLAGRRAQYITPLRLYLTFSVVFFALAALFPSATKGALKVGRTEPGRPSVSASINNPLEEQAAKAERDTDKLGEAVMHNLPRVMFLLMPVFALLTWAFYRRQQPYYVPHLYYSVHFHAFVFFILCVYVLLALAGGPGKIAGALLLWTTVPYHFIALRRVFGGTRGVTIGKGFAIGIVYWIAIIAALLALTLSALRSL